MRGRHEKTGRPADKTVGKHKTVRQHKLAPDAEQRTDQVKAEAVRQIAEPLCEAGGMELVYVEYQRESGGRILRLYIDKPGGIMLDDCVHVSRQLHDILDVDFEDIGPYNLEVTSPGLARPLGKASDFVRFQGHKAEIRMTGVRNKKKLRSSYKGVLLGMSEGEVKLQVDEKIVLIPFQDIARARLVPEKN
ncbi:MAG TPA: ribosome maturation factor RimP [Desulfobacterales bacterium]|nr:MAG: ribosome maturation factor [Deltaproteobacteria bacterium]HHC25642.1 ribosome maturation factor RimP [Desulfobacterales bacterium]